MNLSIALALSLATLTQAQPAANPSAGDPTRQLPETVIASFFDAEEPDRWITINDGVMGGKSTGGPTFADGLLTFSGVTNTNGGGFSSIRTRSQDWDIADADGLLVRVRGDGRTYIAAVETDQRIARGSVSYWQDIPTTEGQWTTLRLPFDSFTPTIRGIDVTGRVEPLDPADTSNIGFYIYDKQDGPFQLDVAWIGTYSDPDTPRSPSEAEPRNARILAALELAITRGVPRFNRGEHGACADIYETALTMLLAASDSLPKDAMAAAKTGLREGRHAESHTDRAWAYRRAIDTAWASLAEPLMEPAPRPLTRNHD